MGWWSTIGSTVLSFFSGAGSVVSVVEEGEKLAAQVTGEVHDHNQRVAGGDAVKAEDNAAKAEVNSNVAKAAVATDDAAALDLLRDGGA